MKKIYIYRTVYGLDDAVKWLNKNDLADSLVTILTPAQSMMALLLRMTDEQYAKVERDFRKAAGHIMFDEHWAVIRKHQNGDIGQVADDVTEAEAKALADKMNNANTYVDFSFVAFDTLAVAQEPST